MEKILKRILCFVICALFVFSIAAPASTVDAATTSKLPVIYIKGRRTPIYNKDGKKVYPMSTSVSDVIDENMSKIVSQALKSYTTKNWNYLGDTLYDLIAPLYKDQRLNKNGEISNGSYIKAQPAPTKKSSGYTLGDYVFEYDSRLDPWATAASLRTYINKVLAATGKKKVQVIGRCMGSDILAAYLVRYKSDPKIDTSIFYAPACNGILIVSAPFSGKIQFDTEQLKKYASKTSANDDDELSGMLNTFYKIFGNIGMELGADIANSIYKQAAPTILPRLLLATYATMPGYWAMVGREYYEDALKTVFGKNARTGSYKNLVAKTDRFKNTVQKNLPSVLKTLRKNGMKINIISKYNVDFDPIYEGCDQQGDGWVETKNTSFGATCAKKGSTLSTSYLNTVTNSGCANYVSGDKIVDSSTALFPDYTWFIKNIAHTTFPSCINGLLYAICNSTSQFTVRSSSSYPQFMNYSGGKLSRIYNYQQVLKPTLGTVKLSSTKMVYDGKAKTPSVIVKDTANKNLVKGTDYTVTYPSSRTNIGKYTVTVKFKGKYNGKAARKLTYYIVPANVKVSSSLSGTSATLSWSKVAGASKYRVYLYNSSSKTYKKVADTSSTSYKLKNLTPGKTYIYAVKAYKTVSGTNYYSSDYGKTTLYLTPSAPKSLKITAGTKCATLKWNAVTGAATYEIFRGNSKTGIFRRVATTTTASYKDEGLWTGKTYYYKVKAIKNAGSNKLESGFSSIVSVKVK
ncbi:MAG: fibronectin type III domain-containing protein [Acutalibacteraceae bacterium]